PSAKARNRDRRTRWLHAVANDPDQTQLNARRSRQCSPIASSRISYGNFHIIRGLRPISHLCEIARWTFRPDRRCSVLPLRVKARIALPTSPKFLSSLAVKRIGRCPLAGHAYRSIRDRCLPEEAAAPPSGSSAKNDRRMGTAAATGADSLVSRSSSRLNEAVAGEPRACDLTSRIFAAASA